MDTTIAAPLVVLLALGVSLLVCVVLVAVTASRSRRRAAQDVAAARAETARLAVQVADLGEQLSGLRAERGTGDAAYVITDAGADLDPTDHRPMVRDTFVLNAALGEPLLRAAALTHGVRRALSPESRGRIRVAMRQESRRVRKQRRREMREVWLAHKRATRDADRTAARAAAETPAETAVETARAARVA